MVLADGSSYHIDGTISSSVPFFQGANTTLQVSGTGFTYSGDQLTGGAVNAAQLEMGNQSTSTDYTFSLNYNGLAGQSFFGPLTLQMALDSIAGAVADAISLAGRYFCDVTHITSSII